MPSSSRASSLSSSDPALAALQKPQGLDEQFLPRIVSVFYSIFHPTEGARVVFQVPEGTISTKPSKGDKDNEIQPPAASRQHNPIFDFQSVTEFIIPKAALCGRLITYGITSPTGQSYKILSHPVILLDQAKYPRKSFLFNVAFVFDGHADTRAYEPIVRKCARELRDLEVSCEEKRT